MCVILLSINPEHVENILNGTKLYEFRKTKCRRNVDKIIIYATAPVMKVVAEVRVEDILVGNPEKIWELTKESAGIDKIFYERYYREKENAVAYKLGSVKKYYIPKKLDEFGIRIAPQSFVYLT